MVDGIWLASLHAVSGALLLVPMEDPHRLGDEDPATPATGRKKSDQLTSRAAAARWTVRPQSWMHERCKALAAAMLNTRGARPIASRYPEVDMHNCRADGRRCCWIEDCL